MCILNKSLKISFILPIYTLIAIFLFAGCGATNAFTLSGTIESTQIDINSEVAGKIIGIEKVESSILKKGDIVAVVDSSMQKLVVKQQKELIKLKEATLSSLKVGTPTDFIDQAKADLELSRIALDQANLILSKYMVKAPISGTLLSEYSNIGDMVNIGSSIGTISDLSKLWVNVSVPERYLNSIMLNQIVAFNTISIKDKIIKGKITYISSTGEFTPKNTETSESKENIIFKVKIEISDNIDLLRPGMTLNASIPILNN